MAKTETGRPRTHWFRVYTGIMDDAKVMQLSCTHFKTWMLTLCMAKEGAGTLPSLDVIAFKLRLRPDVAKKHLDALVEVGLIDCKDNTLTPHNWDKYQYASDVSTTRVERYRERQRNVNGNDNETFQKRPQRTENREQRTDIPQTPASAVAERVSVKAALKEQQQVWFDQWYKAYWKHVKPEAAKKAFFAHVRTETVFAAVMAAVKHQTPYYEAKEKQYRPYPASWINGKCWEDDPDAYVDHESSWQQSEQTTLFVPKPRPVEDDDDNEPFDMDVMFRAGVQQ